MNIIFNSKNKYIFWEEKKIRKNELLTVFTSANDLQTCPRVFLVFVVNPLYKATPDTPNRAATALISTIQILGIKQGYIRLKHLKPLYKATPDTPNRAATALISTIQILGIKQGYIKIKQHTMLLLNFC